ncbi:cobalamin biosynthesis protein CobQ [Patescibacteria group bacterium]|nr:cobalamin biosynthesis protein CobQ [Patescibacteria group bacterium]
MIKIAWLYPDLMSTYGDRGNVITLSYRMTKRKIANEVVKISIKDNPRLILDADVIFMGGAQDKQQEIVNKDLESGKGKFLKQVIEKGVPGLYVCGAYQFLGKYYKAADGTVIPGLDIFDLYTKSPGIKAARLIGNLIVESSLLPGIKLAGFENHTGRTYLGKKVRPFAKVVKGFGNNGEDGSEGMIYKNSIGVYTHGPLLPKNPELADWLILKSIEKKYQKKVKLSKLNDEFEKKAREYIIGREL